MYKITFTFNASGLAGKSVVAFGSLYHEGVEVTVHSDNDDDDQTVIIREVVRFFLTSGKAPEQAYKSCVSLMKLNGTVQCQPFGERL